MRNKVPNAIGEFRRRCLLCQNQALGNEIQDLEEAEGRETGYGKIAKNNVGLRLNAAMSNSGK